MYDVLTEYSWLVTMREILDIAYFLLEIQWTLSLLLLWGIKKKQPQQQLYENQSGGWK